MFKETAEQPERYREHASEPQSGGGSKPLTSVPVEEETAGEQAASDELLRARNKAVRTHRHTPKAGVVPPFSNHSELL